MFTQETNRADSVTNYADPRIRLKSFDTDCWFSIDIALKTCQCRHFMIYQRCEHLDALGVYRTKPFTPTTHPTFSQALSAFVKSIRLRRIDDAVYWLVHLDTFKDAHFRFRTARRVLIASAEDGHSISTMEAVVREFRYTSKSTTELVRLVADAVLICRQPNWWHPASNGPEYIYESLLGYRLWLYKHWDHSAEALFRAIRAAIREQNAPIAIGGVLAFDQLPQKVGGSKQAEFLLAEAESLRNEQAARICRVHLAARSALSADNNFLCQATWLLAGGKAPIANEIDDVSLEECEELLAQATERWQSPEPIPRWCCDGVHCAGDDPRFMGTYPAMWGVCKAYQHYGRVHPDDEWLPGFRCFDGLVVKEGWE